jgi:Site-specific recombinases, DNA invertase Pin homologs
MGDLVLTVLDMVAQMERRFIKERQREGIVRAFLLIACQLHQGFSGPCLWRQTEDVENRGVVSPDLHTAQMDRCGTAGLAPQRLSQGKILSHKFEADRVPFHGHAQGVGYILGMPVSNAARKTDIITTS